MSFRETLAGVSAYAHRAVPDRLRGLLPATGEHRRRAWVGTDRAHIEVRGVHRPGTEAAARQLEDRLLRLAGVSTAETNAVLGRVVVAFDPDLVELEALVAAIDEAEREHGLGDEPFADADHPGDRDPILREAAVIGADLAGAGLSVAGRLLNVLPLPIIMPTLVSTADTSPRVRGAVERQVGHAAADLVLGLAGSAAMTLAQRPLGLMLDAAYRVPRLAEAQARRRAFERREVELGAEGAHRVAPTAATTRPGPLPPGPVEQVAGHAAAAALSAYGVVLAFTRSHARAQGFLAAGVPKAARVGREAFAAQLGQAAANRGTVALDPQVLRRLDRVDTVVLDASVLLTGRRMLEDVAALDGRDEARAELFRRAHELIELERAADGWAVSPIRSFSAGAEAERVREAARGRTRGGATVLVLSHRGRPLALVTVAAELDPLAEAVVAAARGAGRVLVAGGNSRLRHQLAVDGAVAGGSRLQASVRALQEAGHGVALVSARGGAGLVAADVGIGLVGRFKSPPWTADVLCGPGLVEAWRLLDAVAVARAVSRRSAQLAVSGSVAGVLLALAGPARGAARRALNAVDGAAAIALVNGAWNGLSLSRRPPPIGTDRTRWHTLTPDAVLDLLGSSASGLTEADAARRLRSEEPSKGPAQVGLTRATVQELDNPLTAALAAGAGASAAVGSVLDAGLIGTVLAANAVIGGAQRLGADRAMRGLSNISAARLRLRRDGAEQETTGNQLVPGDVIMLTTGDVVPADCRLLAEDGLEMDESGLTGESQLVRKTSSATSAHAVADRRSMIYEGTVVAAGSGTAVVVATGPHTEIGRTSRLAAGDPARTGVAARMHTLSKVTLPASLAAGAVLMGAEAARRRPLGQALGSAVGLTVAAVPEGLPFVATVAELAAARRLSRRGALVRNPTTIEALGRVDVLCFDKTGTLTEARITLRAVSDGVTTSPVDATPTRLREVVAAAVRATPAPGQQEALPHPTYRAVLDGAGAARVSTADGAGDWTRIDEVRFEPGRGYHAVLGRSAGRLLLSVKGAPEVVLARCSRWRRDDRVEPFGAVARRRVDGEVERLARLGYRVLAVAESRPPDRTDLGDARIDDLQFLGLLGLADPVRPTAARAVEQLHHAGVEIVMITGDHPSTAESIAAELGLLDGRGVVTGPALDALDNNGLAAALPTTAVFARVTPAQKVRIVEALHRAGRIVAVTGDGANDAPAIRLADVGLALGRRATPAAREAADVVVTDDRIETITDAIVEGRAMWASVRDALAILLGGNLGEVAFTLATGLAGSPGLNARQLLLVNLLTDMLPAMAVAVRPPPGITPELLLAEGPGSSLGSALTRDIYLRAATTAAAAGLAWLAGRATGTSSRARTVALVALVDAQLLQTTLIGARSPTVIAAGLGSAAALAFIVQTPGVSHFFGSRPLGPAGWTIALSSAAVATLAGAAIPPLLGSHS